MSQHHHWQGLHISTIEIFHGILIFITFSSRKPPILPKPKDTNFYSNTMIWQHFCITFYTIHSFFTNHLSKMNQQKEIHLKQYKNIKLFRMSTIGMTNFRCFKTILIDLNVNKYTFGFTNIWPNKMYYFYTSGTFSYNLTSNISIHICQSFTCLCLKNINTNLLIINYNILLKDILNKSPLKFKIFILS